jgi:NADH dehydrogenase/NADH:ubiquinone oxidoreductase subunit G
MTAWTSCAPSCSPITRPSARSTIAPGRIPAVFDLSALGGAGELSDAPFESPIKAFHLTNPIARASVTMAECAAVVPAPPRSRRSRG